MRSGFGFLLLLPLLAPSSAAAVERPNIIFIMVDDLGPEWIGCYGGRELKTPHIDALAAGGMRFTNAYSMPQCTPTRATLLTGQYPFRHGWCNHWDVPRWGAGCHFDPRHNLTFARVLKPAGYKTAIAGKWQINNLRRQPDALQCLGHRVASSGAFRSEQPPGQRGGVELSRQHQVFLDRQLHGQVEFLMDHQDPGLFGLNQGSMVAIMLLLVFMPAAPREIVPLAALLGGLGVGLLLIGLVGGTRSGGLAILLIGLAVETVLSAITSILILYTPPETSYGLSAWLAGSLFQASWSGAAAFAPWFAVGLIGIAVFGRRLAVYDLGADMARAIGEPVARSRPFILVFAVLMSSTAVSAVGPLTFLGVLAPHLASFVSPATGRARLILSGLTGGALVVAADCLVRGLPSTFSLPIGLGLTLVGVPLFMITLRLRTLRRLQAP